MSDAVTSKNIEGLQKAIEAAGTRTKLSRLLGLTKGAVHQWHQVPLNRVVEVERETKVSRAVLRPDVFGSSSLSASSP